MSLANQEAFTTCPLRQKILAPSLLNSFQKRGDRPFGYLGLNVAGLAVRECVEIFLKKRKGEPGFSGEMEAGQRATDIPMRRREAGFVKIVEIEIRNAVFSSVGADVF